jgi:hypothetical protein
MRSRANVPLLCWLLLGPCCAIASADGGRVVLVERQSDYCISVFASPDPLRAGPIDISILLQDAATDAPVAEAQIDVMLSPRDERGPTIRAAATRAAATNKLLRAALIDLPTAGTWDAEIAVTADRGPADVHFAIEASPSLPRWLTVWPWFTWPVGAVFIFGIHRHLVWRKQRAYYESPSGSELSRSES